MERKKLFSIEKKFLSALIVGATAIMLAACGSHTPAPVIEVDDPAPYPPIVDWGKPRADKPDGVRVELAPNQKVEKGSKAPLDMLVKHMFLRDQKDKKVRFPKTTQAAALAGEDEENGWFLLVDGDLWQVTPQGIVTKRDGNIKPIAHLAPRASAGKGDTHVSTSLAYAGKDGVNQLVDVKDFFHTELRFETGEYQVSSQAAAEPAYAKSNGWLCEVNGRTVQVTQNSDCSFRVADIGGKPIAPMGERKSKVTAKDDFAFRQLNYAGKSGEYQLVDRKYVWHTPLKHEIGEYTIPAEQVFVEPAYEQKNGWLCYIDGDLIQVTASGVIQRLSEKPIAELESEQATEINVRDEFTGQFFHDRGSAYNGVRPGTLRSYYINQTKLKYERLKYFVSNGDVTAEYVPEMTNWMFRISRGMFLGFDYYRVNDDRTIHKYLTKPVVSAGKSNIVLNKRWEGDSEFREDDREITVTGWTLDGDQLMLEVNRDWLNEGRFVDVIYWTQEDGRATYSGTLGVWTYRLGDITYVFLVDDVDYSKSGRRIPVPDGVRRKNKKHRHRHHDAEDDRPSNISGSSDDRPSNALTSGRPANTSADNASDTSSCKRKKHRRSSDTRPSN